MRKIKDVLRLKFDAKLSHQQIADALGLSKGVVTKYAGLAVAAGLDWLAMQSMDEAALERRLLAGAQKGRDYVQPDYGRVHQELRRKGMTLMLLWEEHRADHAHCQTHAYSQYCSNYRRFAKQLKRSMRQVHRAGEKLFIDYAGPTIALIDGGRAHIFVASLGASSYTYACATPSETMADWLESTARALSFYGGVTQLIVPDNPKAMIADANRYEPRGNDTVLDFARHYGTSILPARPYHPQDKAKAESAVQIVERWIMARLRHQQFGSVHEVNAAMAPLLTRLNEKPFQKLPGSRASTFAEIDAPALLPLPLQRYEIAFFRTVKVHIDYHVEVERHRYSVPQTLVGQVLEARITTAVVELLHRGQRVASHARNSHAGGFTTTPAHMPAAHRAQMEWTPQRLIHWGKNIGPATAEAVTRLMAENRHPEHGYRACLGLLSLAKRYGKVRLEAACMMALQIGACQYRHVSDILKNKRTERPCGCRRMGQPRARPPARSWLLPIRNTTTMMMHTTLAQLRTLKLDGLATGLEEQLAQPGVNALSFEERMALLVDREVHCRKDRKLVRLLKNAHLKYGQAAIEDIDARAGRGIDRREVMSLALGDWVSAGHSVLVTGPTSAGKSWLACALAQYACRRGYSAIYQRVPRLQEELRIRHGSGAFGKWLLQLAKTDVLVLDDWGMGAIDSMTRSDLLEIIDDRAGNKATIITSQLPVEHWHAWIGDATIADAILDRVMQRNHRFTLTGDSLRAQGPKPARKEKTTDPS